MKSINIILALMLLGIVSATLAAQNSSLSIRQVRDPVQLRDALNTNAADVQSRVAVLEVAMQTDTNATFDVTTITPGYKGQMLYGSASNILYVAVGTTTNDWKQITME